MFNQNYFLGLDIGTDSIGYAVTDTEYGLLKFHGEPAWGVHLFEEAQLCAERRAFRTARRRLDRRQQRVRLLQELFAPEIAKVDPRFFARQAESARFPDEKLEAFSIFADSGYTDANYHKEFPTIHHLIQALIHNDRAYDVRLVYLACAWLVAHRGHFLNEIDKDNLGALTDFGEVYRSLEMYFTDLGLSIPWCSDCVNALGNALCAKVGITAKEKQVYAACFGNKPVPKAPTSEFPYNCKVLLNGLCGAKIKPADLFDSEAYEEVQSFSLASDDDTLNEIFSVLGDDAELIARMKAIYDWSLLADILGSHDLLSDAKVEVYERHKKDLATLKYIVRKYLPDDYAQVFRKVEKETNNYAAYAYHGDTTGRENKGKASQEDFCAYLKKLLKSVEPQPEDEAAFADMKNRIDLGTFMPKQKNTDNRVIPHQLYWHELKLLLQQAERYTPFLAERDETGLSVTEKILSIFEFRLPYFVGPLNAHSPHAWLKREAGRILPWNYDKLINLDATEQEFIRRMLNHCTYLPSENALPKESLLYHRFTVLNEINNLRINSEPITVEQKQKVYSLFERYQKVTLKKIRDCLELKKEDTLSGTDDTIKSNLKTYHDFKKYLEAGKLTEAEAERIIEQRSYTEDNARFARWLRKNFPALTETEQREIARRSYKDFGRLSEKLLTAIEAIPDPATGEVLSIIGAMWETNLNLMELLSDRFGYAAEIQRQRDEYYAAHPKSIDDRLDDMYISNAVKRPIIRTLDIVKEVTKAFGGAPQKIFIEMARGATPDQKGKRTLARKEQILSLYEKCDVEDVPRLKEQLEAMGEQADSRLQSDKLFLYFMQLGRCVYTGKAINLEALMHADTSDCNIEHIFPQSIVKDDSILNNEVLVDSKANGAKSDTYPVDAAIRAHMLPFWEKLKRNGLMTEEKFKRLTRSTPFTAEERFGFINRQLTETSQATKAVATLLKDICPDSEIVYVKARLASEFRQEFECIKSRLYNDLHHAKDAYLNIVTGNVYHMRFTRAWFRVDENYSVKVSTLFTHPVICKGVTVWDGTPMLEKVKATVRKNCVHMTRYAFCRKGGYFDQMPLKAAEGLIPRKADLPTEKYGGYNKPAITFFLPVKYKVGKKSDILIMPVDLLRKDEVLHGEAAAEQYALKRIGEICGKTPSEVSFPLGLTPLKVNSVIELDGYRYYITGTGGKGKKLLLSSFMPFIGENRFATEPHKGAERWIDTERYIKRLEEMVKKADNPHFIFDEERNKVTKEKNLRLYDLYIKKLRNTIFSQRINSPLERLENNRSYFENELDEVDQARALIAIHNVFTRKPGGCDLSLVRGTAREAGIELSTNVSNWKKNNQVARILYQSASGLWSHYSVNLLELL